MRLRCNNWDCGNLCVIPCPGNKSKIEFVCSFCGHASSYNRSIYPNPVKEDTGKQIDYVLKDVEQILTK